MSRVYFLLSGIDGKVILLIPAVIQSSKLQLFDLNL
jgi:hypothetical protein